MKQLDYGGETNRTGIPLAGVTAAEKEQSGTQAFAAAAEEIAGDFGYRLEGYGTLARELLLDEDEVVSDEVENFLCC